MPHPPFQYDTVLHIGAGKGGDTQAWLDAGVSRIILVEPNPGFADALTGLCAGAQGRVEHVRAAITDQDGNALLNVFNVQGYSSLRHPSALQDLLPGLRQVARLSVPTLSAGGLLGRLGALEGQVLLILDTPGSELDVLQSFHDAGGLERFAELQIVCAEEPLYEGANGRSALQAMAEGSGFLLTQQDNSDPDWPRLTFRPDEKLRLITEMTGRLADLQQAHRAQLDIIHALEGQLSTVTEQGLSASEQSSAEVGLLRSQIHEQDLELARSRDQAQASQTLLQAALDEAAACTAALTMQVHERDNTINALNLALFEQTEVAGAAHGMVATLTRQLAELNSQLHAAADRDASSTAEIDSLKDRIAAQDDQGRAMATQIQAQSGTLAQQEALMADLIEQASRHSTAADAARALVAAGDQRVTELQATLQHSQGDLTEAQRRAQALEVAEQDLLAQVATSAARIDDLEAVLASTRETLTARTAEKDAAVASAREQAQTMADLHKALEAARHDTATQSDGLATAQSRISTLEATLQQAQGDLTEAQHRAQALEVAEQDLLAQVATSAARIDDLEAVLGSTRETLTARTAEKDAAVASAREQAQTMADLHKALEAARIENSRSAEENGKLAERIKDLEFRRDLAKDELRRSEGQLTLIKDLLLRGNRP
jgi:FkbM family methyltransferase